MMSADRTEKESVTTAPDMDSSTVGPESEHEQDIETGLDMRETKTNENDPNVVDWDGPDDLENPMNWSDKKKWLNVTILSIMTMVT